MEISLELEKYEISIHSSIIYFLRLYTARQILYTHCIKFSDLPRHLSIISQNKLWFVKLIFNVIMVIQKTIFDERYYKTLGVSFKFINAKINLTIANRT